jgi:hypothetical protein
MDVPRGKEVARRKLIRRILFIAVIIAAIPLITWGLSRLKPAAPSVDRATVWIDTVKRGPMLREVRGLGNLGGGRIQLDSRALSKAAWKSSTYSRRHPASQRHHHGSQEPADGAGRGRSPRQIKQAQAVYDNLKVTLETQRLAQEAITAGFERGRNHHAGATDVVYVGRPVIGQPGAKITLFKLDPDGKEAQRVPVSLGRSSVNNIEVVDGLKVGDQVILSDMSAQDAYNRIR